MSLILTDAGDGVFAIAMSDRLDTHDVQRYLGRFDAALGAGQPFGVLVAYAGAAPRKDKDGHRLESAWLALHKPAMTRWCFGMALVSNGRLLTALTKIAIKGLGERLLGCPCNAFSEPSAAREWLARRARDHASARRTAP